MWAGRKATFRIFNKKRSQSTLNRSFNPAEEERWLFWHWGSFQIIDRIARRPNAPPLYVFSAELMRWQLDLYFSVRS